VANQGHCSMARVRTIAEEDAKLHHLDDALAAVNVKLAADEISALEEPYVPHAVVGLV
jgi:hypothetical protein